MTIGWKKLFIIVTIIMCFFLLFTPVERIFADDNDSEDFDINKTALPTELTPNSKTTQVKLLVPSEEIHLTNDIVFVVDASDCSYSSIPQLINLLRDLDASQKNNDVSNKIGIVFFRGSAFTRMELSDLTDDMINEMEDLYNKQMTDEDAYENLLTKWGKEADPEYVAKGSNLDSGLQQAQAILDADTGTSADRKYVITITDGLTYFFNDEQDNVQTIYAKYLPSGYASCLLEGFDISNKISQEGKYTVPTGFTWEDYYNKISGLVEADKDEYVADYRKVANAMGVDYTAARTIPSDKEAAFTGLGYKRIEQADLYAGKHATSVDRAIYESYNKWKEMVDEGYNCYYYPASKGDGTSFKDYFAAAMNKASGHGSDIDFDEIENEIIYAVETGKLTDKIEDHFDLVDNGTDCPFTLSVKGETLPATKTGDNEWSFGKADESTGVYPFVLTYTADGADGTGETIEVAVNTHIAYSERLVLSYELELVGEPKGTLPDVITNYDTNESAVMDFTRTDGETGTMTFPVPKVTYIPNRTITVTKDWNETLVKSPVTVELYRDGEPTGKTIVITGNNNWIGQFEDLDRYKEDRVSEYEYTVKEVDTRWINSVSGNMDDGFVIKNESLSTVTTDDPPVKKEITGDDPKSDSEFTFELKALPDESTLPDDIDQMPMPAAASGASTCTTEIEGEGMSEFGTITFTEPGTYVYQVMEKTRKEKGYTYDKTVYKVTYVVTRKTDNSLDCSRTIYKDDASTTSNEFTFVNEYKTLDAADSDKDDDNGGSSVQTSDKGDDNGGSGVRTSDKGVDNDGGGVRTGDSSSSARWLIVFAAAAAAMVVLLIRHRGKN